MKGRKRVLKGHIRERGWRLEDLGRGRAAEDAYRLVLTGPGGAIMTVDAPTRPLAYRRADRLATQVTREIG
jgi:hypothetical protein